MKTKLPFGKGVRSIVLWLAGSLAALAVILAVMQHAARVQLESDAEHAALHWAAFARDTVPDLDQAFAGRGFTPEALRQLRRLRQAGDVFRFTLFDPEGRQLLASDQLGEPAASSASVPVPDPHDGIRDPDVRAVVFAGSPHVELRQSTRADRPPVFSEAYVPVVRDARVLGVVEVYVDQAARGQRIAWAFREVAGVVATLVLALGAIGAWQWFGRLRGQRRAEARARYLTHHDALTGLFNRASFHDAMRQAQWRAEQGGTAFAVLCIDLDRFKDVNETLGQGGGDDLLRSAGLRLRETVGPLDVVARLGGDEFAVLQSVVRAPEDVAQLGRRLAEALGRPCAIAGQAVNAGGSVGAAVYGVDGVDRTALMHKAGLALERAKADRRGSFSFYDPAMDQQLQSRRALARDLRQALYDGDLHLHFQPLYERDGRTLGGYEALVRWTHPQRGPIGPAEFIPIAEESDLIDDLGLWVLAQACAEAASWPSSLSVSVNLSAAQFRRGDGLVRTVASCLDGAGLAAHRLELEITESLLIDNTEQVVHTLHQLTGMGVRIAMDDFGTGYSSLSYLWRFPFDKVKIDRAFTQHLGQDPKVDLIVRSIVSLAHSLDIRVNAEGVETEAQLRCLQAHGCDELQGFLLGRPAPPAQLRHVGAPESSHARVPRAMTDFAVLSTRSAAL
jgi:diguanylate cyclase (GGDEF)-like protein